MEKLLDKAASDPAWKQRLLDDPEAAMREANFPEAQQLEQTRAGAGEGEVRGQALPGGGAGGGGDSLEGAVVPLGMQVVDPVLVQVVVVVTRK